MDINIQFQQLGERIKQDLKLMTDSGYEIIQDLKLSDSYEEE